MSSGEKQDIAQETSSGVVSSLASSLGRNFGSSPVPDADTLREDSAIQDFMKSLETSASFRIRPSAQHVARPSMRSGGGGGRSEDIFVTKGPLRQSETWPTRARLNMCLYMYMYRVQSHATKPVYNHMQPKPVYSNRKQLVTTPFRLHTRRTLSSWPLLY